MGDWRSKNRSGKNAPSWKGGKVRVECERCDTEFDVKPVRANKARFCSYACRNEWLTTQTGQDHPNWKGGRHLRNIVVKQLHGPSWTTIREEHVSSECQNCGIDESQFDRGLDLHHIVPIQAGGTNQGYNLITLCRSCHKKAESYTTDFTESVLSPTEI
ncbi:HNH endonuclease [Haloarcula salinisoli]